MRRAIIDLRSVLWTAIMAGRDKEFGRKVVFNDKEVFINSADHGYENAVDHILLVLDDLHIQPRDVIFVDEGRNSKLMRTQMFDGYKAGRDQPEDQRVEFNKAKERVLQAFLGVGASLCWQEGMEADDVIGYLARNLKGDRYIVSNDGDLAVCIDPENGAHLWRLGQIDHNPYGPFDPEYIPVYKALVGDSSDKYPGAYKFGEGAFLKLLGAFGEDGLDFMRGLIEKKQLLKLHEDVAEMKELQRVIDGADMVYTSYALAKLYPEKVNTLRRPLQWRVGMVKPIAECEDERLTSFSGQVRLIHAGNYEKAVAWAAERIAESPYVTLDIETSTPPESDEWLAAQDKDDGNAVDVFGSELTGLGVSFGRGLNFTFYLTCGHKEEENVTNLKKEQLVEFIRVIPRDMKVFVHNAQFELPVIYESLGRI